MKAYFALYIIMPRIKKSDLKTYWSERPIVHTLIFSQTIPFRKFLAISRFLHLADNEKADDNDKLKMIRNSKFFK